jgi:hypothetical protein
MELDAMAPVHQQHALGAHANVFWGHSFSWVCHFAGNDQIPWGSRGRASIGGVHPADMLDLKTALFQKVGDGGHGAACG